MPSLFKQEIEKLILAHSENRARTFSGIVLDYDHENKTCSVEVSNITGPGRVILSNRAVPDFPKGVVPGGIRKGSVVILVSPGGEYQHAEIVAIRPPGEYYWMEERREEDKLPRNGKSALRMGALK